MITVVIPVGPDPVYKDFLKECLDSVRAQEEKAAEILIIDDQAWLSQADVGPDVHLWRTPWLSGVSHAFNFGVSLAAYPLVFMLGSDDRIEPWCLKDCMKSYMKHRDELGYYYVDVQYSDGRSQNLACHAAMVTKKLWQHNGGFPVEAAVGASDTIMISSMMAAKGAAGRLRHIESERPPYWYRVHPRTDTVARGAKFFGVIAAVREEYSNRAVRWERPKWLESIR